VVQNNGEEDCFYLIKGRFRTKNPKSTLLTDTWVYHPTTQEWKVIEPSEDAIAFPLAAGTAMAVGANHILLLGGDDGQLFNQLEQLGADIQAATDTSLQQTLIAKRDDLLKNHPGFTKDIWAFHTITQTWTPMPPLPAQSQVTTTAVRWEDQILIPSGEIAPCIRTPKIMAVSLQNKISFGTINYVVLMVYLAILIGIGLFFSKNQHSTEDFFKGGHRIPWWAAGLSIFGTQLSAITFMAVPAKTFATDWLYFFLMMTILMVAPFIIRFFLPFYRRFKLTTAYEYLELRFNLATRLLGSTMYIFLQIGRLGIVLLLPSLALSVVTGIDVYSCILSMGILSILYTVLGGIEAVIWTDVVQVIVLLGGALLSLILLFFSLDSQDISTYVTAFQKTRIFDFEWSFSHPTLWVLFVYYKTHPALLSPILEKTDTIFPWYIVNSLPQGVSGLLIAAIFAASMSSLDSSMNSVATVITTDFFRRLRPLKNEAAYLQLARRITIIIGIMGTGLALMMASWGISSLWDQFNLIVGLFAGGLGGVFLLGIFSKTANGSGALIGLLLSGLIQYYVKSYTQVHLLLYAFTGMISCILIGYWVSKLLGQQQASKMHYTYYHMKQHSQTADVNHF
jgi:Na+/proline symporter